MPRIMIVALVALLSSCLATAAEPPEINVQVLEDAWKIGDEKTYTLLFDRAPIGRHAMLLVEIRQGPDGQEAVFRQRLTLDLRALGQEGRLEHSGTVIYGSSGQGPYRYEELVSRDQDYETYRGRGDLRDLVEVELDPGARRFAVSTHGREEAAGRLPDIGDAILVDFLMLGHWERVFAARPRWALGETYVLPLLVPAPPARMDFHLALNEPRSVQPELIEAQVTVEALEEIDLFGARIRAFRCRVEPPGMTLWVSPNGGVLRFDDGRGLTGALEP